MGGVGNFDPNSAYPVPAVVPLPTTTRVAVESRGAEQIDLFWAGPNGDIWTTWWNSAARWANHLYAITNRGVAPAGAPVAVESSEFNRLDVFWAANSGDVWTNYWPPPGGTGFDPTKAYSITRSTPPPAAPTVTSVTPSNGDQGASGITITIFGTNFTGAAATGVSFGSGITVVATGFSVNLAGTQITGTISIDATATPGPRIVSVRNGAGQTGSKANAFTVNQPWPLVQDISRPTTESCRGYPVSSALRILWLRNQGRATVTITAVAPHRPSNWGTITPPTGLPREIRPLDVQMISAAGTCTPPGPGESLNLALDITIRYPDGSTQTRGMALTDSDNSLVHPMAVNLHEDVLTIGSKATDMQQIAVQILNLSGQLIFRAQASGNSLTVALAHANFGRPLANGVYLVAITAQKVDGTCYREVQKIMVMR